MRLRKLINSKELWVGEKKGLIIEGIRILLVHTESGFYAFTDSCPHAGALLSEGSLANDHIICGRHHWQFDACTGQGINPSGVQLQSYPLSIDAAQDIWIELPEEEIYE
jgi:toluene monooxygenase system ferredoxin subunit